MLNASDAYPLVANVKAEMARRGISQEEVSRALGLTQPQVSRRLAGRVEFSASEVPKLSELLDVSVASLFGEANASTRAALAEERAS